LARVLIITQQFDPRHPVLATTVAQLNELAKHVDELVVVADRIERSALPANARAYSFASRFKVLRGVKVLGAVARELPRLRRDGVVVAHMCPVYGIIVAPLVRPSRVPLLLWHVHWKQDLVVRTSERVVDKVITVDGNSFPFPDSRKVVPIGQAIDVERFAYADRSGHSGPLRVVVVGRYSPAKGLDTILRAARTALDRGVELRLDFYGPALTPAEIAHRRQVEELVRELSLGEQAALHEALLREDTPQALAEADVLVNNARGGADRIVYEAAATGLVVLASNPAHRNLLEPGAFYPADDPAALADRLADVAALSGEEREARGRELADKVRREHSYESWSLGLLRAAGLYSNQPSTAPELVRQ
jgi:glycosyltransferase involved in cell wall biosynthesis